MSMSLSRPFPLFNGQLCRSCSCSFEDERGRWSAVSAIRPAIVAQGCRFIRNGTRFKSRFASTFVTSHHGSYAQITLSVHGRAHFEQNAAFDAEVSRKQVSISPVERSGVAEKCFLRDYLQDCGLRTAVRAAACSVADSLDEVTGECEQVSSAGEVPDLRKDRNRELATPSHRARSA